MKKKDLFDSVFAWFRENMPEPETELNYNSPYELLVAVILSAQCTDKRVNIITPGFFSKFPNVQTLASSEIEEIFQLIKSCSYPNNKAKNLHGMAKTIMNDFAGKVPGDLDQLQKIPGVGRKTANVILSVIFNKPALAVDSHVMRVSARIGLSSNARTPFETEKQLLKYIPEELIPKAHHWLILHGRYICIARNPKCDLCGLKKICKYYSLTIEKQK